MCTHSVNIMYVSVCVCMSTCSVSVHVWHMSNTYMYGTCLIRTCTVGENWKPRCMNIAIYHHKISVPVGIS